MFSVNVIQWFLEVLFLLIFHVKIYSNQELTKLQERFWILYINIHINVVNAFYLFGDSEFHRSVTEVGVLKSVQRAFFQSY